MSLTSRYWSLSSGWPSLYLPSLILGTGLAWDSVVAGVDLPVLAASDFPWPAALLAFMGVASYVSCPPSPATTSGSLVANMTSIIPQANHRLGQVVFVTQGTHARRAQEEVATGARFESQPSSCKHAQA